MMPDLFLGVDGGQSSTTALVADSSGRVLGCGTDGPCNHVKSAALGREKFIRVIGGCIRAAASQAGLEGIPAFRAACLGFSGGPADKEPILREILRAGLLDVTTDGAIALAGATAGGPGIITVAGTGSICMGRGASGRVARAGGWGYLFGDEGGGFNIVRDAVRACLRIHEGWGEPTSLYSRLLGATGFTDANDMAHAFYTADWPRPRVAALSKLVDEEAEGGDTIATSILRQTARDLLVFPNAVRRQVFAPGEPVLMCPVGSVWKSRILRATFIELWTIDPCCTFREPQYGPAAGALLEAFRISGTPVQLHNLPEAEK